MGKDEFDEAAEALVSEGFRPTPKDNENNELIINTADLVPPRLQVYIKISSLMGYSAVLIMWIAVSIMFVLGVKDELAKYQKIEIQIQSSKCP